MKRTILLFAVAILVSGASGCGSCKNFFSSRHQVAKPVYSQYAPACGPACTPGCKSCGNGSNVTTPVTTYFVPSEQGSQIEFPQPSS